MPTRLNREKKELKGVGYFCSDECLLAFYADNPKAATKETGMLIELLMLKRFGNGKRPDYKRAMDRSVLKMFGGQLTIDQFRSGHVKATEPEKLLPYKLVQSRYSVQSQLGRLGVTI